MTPRIRVLVIGHSAYSRQAISRMLRSSPLVEVVAVARDAEEGLRKLLDLLPDLVTVDLEMPRLDGHAFLRVAMARRPTPVIAISNGVDDPQVFRALEVGAVDFVSRPSVASGRAGLEGLERELIRKVHAVRAMRMDRISERIDAQPALLGLGNPRFPWKAVAIGASTGGPSALMQIFSAFSEAPDCAILVAQHMPEGFTRSFAERLDRLTLLRAAEARGGERPGAGEILVAPGGRHLRVEVGAGHPVVRLEEPGSGDRHAPSIDRLFVSAAKAYGEDLLAIVLTGMGDDGAEGARAVKQAGGQVVAESEESAVVFGMPRQAIRTGVVDRVLPLHDIAGAIQHGVAPAASP